MVGLYLIQRHIDPHRPSVPPPVPERLAPRDAHLQLLRYALEFGVWGLGFRVEGFGFRFQGFGLKVSGFGFRVSGLGVWV